ncbi:hypothetical protein TSH7_08930 [Azospirillum sp. TSH7]|uniref:hypothetical protein n=1 Tax=unclassified Azospirillum TaxID=2630922 RepID=UPI000D616DF6|nr:MULTISPECIES: hypothetical protein [unclassified Azospirillum]PWC65288.1 hypothetical protein TSH7_08930 [Azospirillum sp. TSH7]PWC71799.1 hypothetical protein TSH20_03060 [Azospirillum sp. TSH20]
MSYDFERERYERRRRRVREARREYEEAMEAAVQVPPVLSDTLVRWNAAFTDALRLWDQSHDWRLYRS